MNGFPFDFFEGREETLFAPGPCALCNRNPAVGFASINGKWFCHGDYDPSPTCYMRSQSEYTRPQEVQA